ncbi:MAG: site-2 protease family protein [Betaproteobacteria bacterium]|nr:site-2 protease family protein [Betaproteobacteria bacterium]MBI2960153.1 site-2 protease family protein [Betaproteobacteria bacterium]
MELNLVQKIAIYALPVIFAITLHEAAHGYVARHFGDSTAHRLGRISLNPIRHIDLIGTIVLPLVILVTSSFFGGAGMLFGWAKPVPVNFSALRDPKRDMLWVAAAGPAANLGMAIGWAVVFKVALSAPQNMFTIPASLMADAGIAVNVVLMVLNLLPILPLDGGRIAVSLLPERLALPFARLEPFGLPILLVLLFTNTLGSILIPVVQVSIGVIDTVFQLGL